MGTGHRRAEGWQKVTGRALFTADAHVEGSTFARFVLSPHAHARLLRVDSSAATARSGVLAVFTAADLPKAMCTGSPEDALASDWVKYAGQPVAVVVGETEADAADGAALVDVEYEPLPALLTIWAAMDPSAPVVVHADKSSDRASGHVAAVGGSAIVERPHNATAAERFVLGDPEVALSQCVAVIDRRYLMGGVHQGFMEPHVCLALPDGQGGIKMWTSSQALFETRASIAEALGLEERMVVVRPVQVGGGFGGKFFVLLEPLTAFLATRLERPVLLALTRSEEFAMGRAAPACTVDLKLGAAGDGSLRSLYARVYYNSGACVGWHGAATAQYLLAPYTIPNYDVAGFDISTHTAPTTAYRAPGAPQAFFPMESAMDELSQRLGIDPIEIRLRNAVCEGDRDPKGELWGRVGLVECLAEAALHPIYTRPAGEGEGVGVAVGGLVGINAAASALCRVDRDGGIVLTLGTVDLTGSDTAFQVLAGETLAVAPEEIRIEKPDSSEAPLAPGTGGSMSIYSVGPAVQAAAAELRHRLLQLAAEQLEIDPSDLDLDDGCVVVRGVPGRELRVKELASRAIAMGHGDALSATGHASVSHPAPVFTVQVARASVDVETGQFVAREVLAVQDVGRALNPPEIEAQIHGGMLQGLGRALGEEMLYDGDGQLRTGTFVDYLLPSIDQAPAMEVRLVEIPSELGPLGARLVGEPPATPGGAPLANAISRATGKRVTALPIDSESLVRACAE